MKKILIILLALCMVSLCVGCGNTNFTDIIGDKNQKEAVEDVEDEETEPPQLSASELKKAVKDQPCYVKGTKYAVQSDEYKALYPDIMIAKAVNNSGATIKDIVIAFAAWDKDGLPLILDEIDDDYVVQCSMKGINLKDSDKITKNGLEVDTDMAEEGTIDKFKAIVVEYTYFDGEKWENPYFEDWKSLYEGKELN